MKFGTAAEMPKHAGNNQYKIPYREIAAGLLTGEIRTITCGSREELKKVRIAARASIQRLLHGKKLMFRTEGNTFYLQVKPEIEIRLQPSLPNGKDITPQETEEKGV